MIQVSSQRSYSGYIYQLIEKQINRGSFTRSSSMLDIWSANNLSKLDSRCQISKNSSSLEFNLDNKGPCIYIIININTSPQATEIVLWFCKGCGSSLRIGLCAGIWITTSKDKNKKPPLKKLKKIYKAEDLLRSLPRWIDCS